MLVTEELILDLEKLLEKKEEGYLALFEEALRTTRYDPQGLKGVLLGWLLAQRTKENSHDPLSIFISVYANDFIQKAAEIDNITKFFG